MDGSRLLRRYIPIDDRNGSKTLKYLLLVPKLENGGVSYSCSDFNN